MKKFKIILIIIIFAIAVIIALQNRENVTTRLLLVTITMPHMLLMIVTFAAGFFVGLIVASLLHRKTPKIKKV